MVEVLDGPKHYELEAKSKDEALWISIIKRLGIRSYLELREEIETQRFPITTPTTASDLEEKLPRVVWHGAQIFSRIHFVGRPKVTINSHGTPILEILPSYRSCPEHAVISVWPAWRHFNGGMEEILKDQLIKPENAAKFFYIPKMKSASRVSLVGLSDYYINGVAWCNAVISVEEAGFLPVATKIAKAYESETARRRKPAKAFVLKNY